MKGLFSLFLLLFSLSSCATLFNADLLQADFETTPVGEQPPSDLPGPPDGDALRYSPSASTYQPLEVIRLDVSGKRALRMLPVYSKPVFFESAQADTDSENFQISFTAMAANRLESGLLISFAADTMQTAATLRMQDGEVHLRIEQDGQLTYEKLGEFLPDERQTFIFNLNRPENSYSLNIIRESNPELRAEHMAFNETDDMDTPSRLRLYFEFMNPEESPEGSAWVVDDVQMQQQ